jgi:hypothetical protein
MMRKCYDSREILKIQITYFRVFELPQFFLIGMRMQALKYDLEELSRGNPSGRQPF